MSSITIWKPCRGFISPFVRAHGIFHSLRLLQQVKEVDPSLFTKSGLMVGLGESKEEVMQVMDDMRSAGVDFLTIAFDNIFSPQ